MVHGLEVLKKLNDEADQKKDKKTLIYLATPYSHPDPDVRQWRFEVVTRVAGQMISDGKHVYSPITHSHPIAIRFGLPYEFDFWEAYDRAFLKECREMVILMQDGWRESKGVVGEINIAGELGVQVEYMSVPDDC